MELVSCFRERIKELRQERELTLDMLVSDLNEKYPDMNVNKSMISRWESGKNDPTLGNAKITALNDQKSKLETELENIDKEIRESLQPSEALKLIETLDDVVKNADYDGIRAVVSALIDHIDIDGDDITIYWNFY